MTEKERSGDGAAPWVLASVATAVAGSAAASAWAEPAAFAVAAPAAVAVLGVGARATGSDRLAWLLVFGAVFGVLELAVDWYHVAQLGSFVYRDHGGLRVVASPWYMPLGWAGLVAQLGYGALWLSDRVESGAAVVAAAGVAGAVLPPWYEQFAATAGAWHYPRAAIRVLATPVWVMAGYGLTTATVAAAVLALHRPRDWWRAVVAGVVAVAVMFPASLAAFEVAVG